MLKRVGAEIDLLQCPYNVSHQILRHRFQVHLVRCRKSYPNSEVITCPLNITHRVNKEELNWHVSTCPDRQSFEVFKTCDAPMPGLPSSVNKSFCGARCELAESDVRGASWDDDPDVPSYDPQQYVDNAQILRNPVGMPPAQRAAFRQAERKRLHTLMNYDIHGRKQ